MGLERQQLNLGTWSVQNSSERSSLSQDHVKIYIFFSEVYGIKSYSLTPLGVYILYGMTFIKKYTQYTDKHREKNILTMHNEK